MVIITMLMNMSVYIKKTPDQAGGPFGIQDSVLDRFPKMPA
jgi:hypothetical protein